MPIKKAQKKAQKKAKKAVYCNTNGGKVLVIDLLKMYNVLFFPD